MESCLIGGAPVLTTTQMWLPVHGWAVAVASNKQWSDIMDCLHLTRSGKGYKSVKNNCKHLGIDTSHIKQIGPKGRRKELTLEEYEQKDKISNKSMIKKLLEAKVIEDQCSICKIDEWMSKPITLQLDHIDGNKGNNTRENLRLVCPNCHSQTSTWGGRNIRRKKKRCVSCGKVVNKHSTRCGNCEGTNRLDKDTRTEWPSDEKLVTMLKNNPYTVVARELKVSDNAIRNRLKRRNLKIPRNKWSHRLIDQDISPSN